MQPILKSQAKQVIEGFFEDGFKPLGKKRLGPRRIQKN